MRSAGLCVALVFRAWWGPGRRSSAAHNPWAPGSEAGEPVEQSEVLGPFRQVVGDCVGVGGFEGSAFRLGRGACVDLGGGQVDVPEDVSDVGQRDACLTGLSI
jgi:hypothetical protein